MTWIKYRGIIPERTEDCPNGEFGALVVAKDCNIGCKNCFNQHLKNSPIYEDTPEMIVAKIKRNPLHTWCVLGGLEWSMDPYGLVFIAEEALRNNLNVLIYTGRTYEEFEQSRSKLIEDVNILMTNDDKRFLVSFEKGNPQWAGYEFEYFKEFPSVKWKLMNLAKLSKLNPQKLTIEAKKLEKIFGI